MVTVIVRLRRPFVETRRTEKEGLRVKVEDHTVSALGTGDYRGIQQFGSLAPEEADNFLEEAGRLRDEDRDLSFVPGNDELVCGISEEKLERMNSRARSCRQTNRPVAYDDFMPEKITTITGEHQPRPWNSLFLGGQQRKLTFERICGGKCGIEG